MDEESFKIMRSHISIHNSNHPWLSMTNEEFLKSLFWGKQRGTNREGYKLAAILFIWQGTDYSELLPVASYGCHLS